MTSPSSRRPGFRLPWSGDPPSDDPESAPRESAPGTEQEPPTDPQQVGANGSDRPADAPAPDAPAQPPAAAPSASVAPSESPDAFLGSLVDAMRRVADQSRATSTARLQTAVAEHVAQMRTAASQRADALRQRSELDISGIGEWEKAEIERIGAEARSRIEARETQLEHQLTEHQERIEQEIDTLQSRVTDYERELEVYFARLNDIHDPTAFVAAAKRMPRSPLLDVKSGEETAPVAVAAKGTPRATLDERLADLGIDHRTDAAPETPPAKEPANQASKKESAAPAPATDAKASTATKAAPAESTGTTAATGSEVATAIVVKGLGSFGAITSFKQALERVDGVDAVTLSLGPTGEFVYRATHGASFDLTAAIDSLENGTAQVERQPDGSLRVTVNRGR